MGKSAPSLLGDGSGEAKKIFISWHPKCAFWCIHFSILLLGCNSPNLAVHSVKKDRNGVPVVKKRTGTAFRCVPVPNEPCLSAFILNLLLRNRIHASMRSTQEVKRWTDTDADATGALMYPCVVVGVRVPDESGIRDDLEQLSSVQQEQKWAENRALWHAE